MPAITATPAVGVSEGLVESEIVCRGKLRSPPLRANHLLVEISITIDEAFGNLNWVSTA